ncbi:MAG: putative zinc-binding protein [Planctomycetota bacterium]
MANSEKGPVCRADSRLIFACSGAADVGEISDLVARKLAGEGVGRMFCLAGIGARIEPIMSATKSAGQILAIDGCGMDCVKNCLDQAGFDNFQHLRITEMGMEKGKSPAAEERVADAAERVKDLLSHE